MVHGRSWRGPKVLQRFIFLCSKYLQIYLTVLRTASHPHACIFFLSYAFSLYVSKLYNTRQWDLKLSKQPQIWMKSLLVQATGNTGADAGAVTLPSVGYSILGYEWHWTCQNTKYESSPSSLFHSSIYPPPFTPFPLPQFTYSIVIEDEGRKGVLGDVGEVHGRLPASRACWLQQFPRLDVIIGPTGACCLPAAIKIGHQPAVTSVVWVHISHYLQKKI